MDRGNSVHPPWPQAWQTISGHCPNGLPFLVFNVSRPPGNIHITTKNEQGKMTLNWKVSPNLEIGEPRQLAYKIDSLVVNRRIHELGRPLPKIIKLGSIRKIGEEIGRPPSLTKPITNAIKQNAGVLIDATIDYVGK